MCVSNDSAIHVRLSSSYIVGLEKGHKDKTKWKRGGLYLESILNLETFESFSSKYLQDFSRIPKIL